MDMDHVWKEQVYLRASECDMMGTWRPDAILTCMQETAGAHSAMFGLDRKTMDDMGICWILSRVKVEMQRVPKVYESVAVETYPLPQRHLFFPRVHIFRSSDGEEVGAASALWMLMDLSTRRVTASDAVSSRLPKVPGLYNPAGMPGTVRLPDAGGDTGSVVPRYTELDLNRHVNNTKYMAWCMDALGADCMTEKEILSFQINYDAEVRYGTKVGTRLIRNENAFAFAGFDGEKQLFAAEGALRKRSE